MLALGLRGSGRLGLTGRRWNGRPNVASATSTSSGAKSIVNLAAAHAIGIAIPESFLLRATQVIERVRFVTGVSSGVRRKTARSFQPESASSRVAAFISRRVFSSCLLFRSGRFLSKFRIHSSWMRSVHLARNKSVRASCIKKSRRGAGYRTQA